MLELSASEEATLPITHLIHRFRAHALSSCGPLLVQSIQEDAGARRPVGAHVAPGLHAPAGRDGRWPHCQHRAAGAVGRLLVSIPLGGCRAVGPGSARFVASPLQAGCLSGLCSSQRAWALHHSGRVPLCSALVLSGLCAVVMVGEEGIHLSKTLSTGCAHTHTAHKLTCVTTSPATLPS